MEKPDFNELKCLSSDAKGARLGGRGPGLESKLPQLQSHPMGSVSAQFLLPSWMSEGEFQLRRVYWVHCVRGL